MHTPCVAVRRHHPCSVRRSQGGRGEHEDCCCAVPLCRGVDVAVFGAFLLRRRGPQTLSLPSTKLALLRRFKSLKQQLRHKSRQVRTPSFLPTLHGPRKHTPHLCGVRDGSASTARWCTALVLTHSCSEPDESRREAKRVIKRESETTARRRDRGSVAQPTASGAASMDTASLNNFFQNLLSKGGGKGRSKGKKDPKSRKVRDLCGGSVVWRRGGGVEAWCGCACRPFLGPVASPCTCAAHSTGPLKFIEVHTLQFQARHPQL